MEIEEGLILLSSDCDQRNLFLKRNYLLTFNNCKIKINNKTFTNTNKEFKDNFLLPTNIKINNTKIERTFDDIVLSNLQNMEKIKELKYRKISHSHFSIVMPVTLLIIFVLMYLVSTLAYKKYKKLKTKIREYFQTKGGEVLHRQLTHQPSVGHGSIHLQLF